MAEWFVFDGVAERGPFSEDDFFSFLKDKDPPQIKIWRDGLDAWVPAKSIPTLVAMMKPAAPPQPVASPIEKRSAAAAAAPADITITAGDHFAQTADDEDVPSRESKWHWAIYGAGAGFAWGLLHVAIGRAVPSFTLLGADIIASLLVPIGLRVLGLAIIGFAAGCVRDAFRKEPADETAEATGGSAPANENRPPDGAAKAA